MKNLFLFLSLFLLISHTAWAGGDEIELKDGTVIKGNIVAKNVEQIYIDVNHEVKRIDISEIHQIRFGPTIKNPTPVTSAAPASHD